MKTTLQEIGSRIRKARKEAGLSQADIGEVIGVKFGAVSKYESGTSDCGVESLAKIAKKCRVSLDWLITGQENTSEQVLQHKVAEGIISESASEYGNKPLTVDEEALLNFYRAIPDEKKPVAIERISAMLISSRINKG